MSPLPAPSESAVRRALVRAERGVALDAVEAETLLHARGLGEGEPLDRLLTAAGRVRDAGLTSAGRPGVVGGIGAALGNEGVAQVGTISRIILPTDGLWRGAMNAFQDPTALAQMGPGQGGFPFLSASALTPAYVAWAVVWIAVVWGLTALSFSRRDV